MPDGRAHQINVSSAFVIALLFSSEIQNSLSIHPLGFYLGPVAPANGVRPAKARPGRLRGCERDR